MNVIYIILLMVLRNHRKVEAMLINHGLRKQVSTIANWFGYREVRFYAEQDITFDDMKSGFRTTGWKTIAHRGHEFLHLTRVESVCPSADRLEDIQVCYLGDGIHLDKVLDDIIRNPAEWVFPAPIIKNGG